MCKSTAKVQKALHFFCEMQTSLLFLGLFKEVPVASYIKNYQKIALGTDLIYLTLIHFFLNCMINQSINK